MLVKRSEKLRRRRGVFAAFCMTLVMVSPQIASALTPEQQAVYDAVMFELKTQKALLHYLSVNSTGTGDASNYNNDGAGAADSIAIGMKAKTDGMEPRAIAIGVESYVGGNGIYPSKSGIAIGTDSRVQDSPSGIALGHRSLTSMADRAVALGPLARVYTDGGVALGSDSYAIRRPFLAPAYAPFSGFKLTVDNTFGALAIGNEEKMRQIVFVADGTEDSDAVNLRQLKALDKKIAAGIHFMSINESSSTAENFNNDGAQGISSIAIGPFASVASDSDFSVALGTHARVLSGVRGGMALGLLSVASVRDGVALGSMSVADRGAFGTATLAPFSNVDLHGVTFGAVSVGGPGMLRQIINVGDGTQDTDAVNLRQLKAVDVKIEKVSASDVLSIKYDSDKKDTITLGGVGASKPVALTNLKDGTVAAGSTHAVTGNQLYTATQDITTILGGNATNTDGQVTTSDIGGTGKNTIHDAIASIHTSTSSALQSWSAEIDGRKVKNINKTSSNLNFITGDNIILSNEQGAVKISTAKNVTFDTIKVNQNITTGNTTISNKGLTIKDGPSVTDKGIDAGNKSITNVKPGISATDVATVGQVNEVVSSIGSNWNAVSNRLHGMDRRISSVGAMAAAFSTIMPLDFDELNPTMFSVGYGYYSGQSAISLGVQHYANRDLLFNGGIAWSNDEKMFRLGATWRMGTSPKYKTERVSTGELKALRRVDELEGTVQNQQTVIEALEKRLSVLEGKK